ncbi:hypothetical protein ES319_D03G171400v1 [Gossypium barbadense]|uniref:FLZ-type domain-containing protein n=1 Tax=Gossypium barbadense TaxID=3634 RepID=A0A5J5S8J3_GOSBA|nr:hypothetical protein ES319_D03G171400v1 [Gossypium barbadense]
MHNFCGKKRPAINLNLFTSLSHSFFCLNPTKTPSNFQYGVVGLGIVAAMTDSTHTHQSICFAPSPRSTPIPIVSSVKAAPSFGGGFNSEKFDELSDNDTSVISHFSDNLIKNQFGFGDDNKNCSGFTAAPSPRKNNMGQFKREFWSDGFLTSCHLCSGGEEGFCSADCRDKQIRSDDHKQICALDCSQSSPHVLFSEVAAA